MFYIIVGTVFMTLIQNITAYNVLEKKSNNFGPYSCTWEKFGLCQGPKAKNVSMVTTEVVKQGEEYICHVNLTFFSPTHLEEIRILVYVLNGNTKNVLWSYNLKDPCQHFAFASTIEKNLNVKNCVVSKGDYACVTNLTEIMNSFLGPSFFYGKYVMKATVISKKGNILCILTNINIAKKAKENQQK